MHGVRGSLIARALAQVVLGGVELAQEVVRGCRRLQPSVRVLDGDAGVLHVREHFDRSRGDPGECLVQVGGRQRRPQSAAQVDELAGVVHRSTVPVTVSSLWGRAGRSWDAHRGDGQARSRRISTEDTSHCSARVSRSARQVSRAGSACRRLVTTTRARPATDRARSPRPSTDRSRRSPSSPMSRVASSVVAAGPQRSSPRRGRPARPGAARPRRAATRRRTLPPGGPRRGGRPGRPACRRSRRDRGGRGRWGRTGRRRDGCTRRSPRATVRRGPAPPAGPSRRSTGRAHRGCTRAAADRRTAHHRPVARLASRSSGSAIRRSQPAVATHEPPPRRRRPGRERRPAVPADEQRPQLGVPQPLQQVRGEVGAERGRRPATARGARRAATRRCGGAVPSSGSPRSAAASEQRSVIRRRPVPPRPGCAPSGRPRSPAAMTSPASRRFDHRRPARRPRSRLRRGTSTVAPSRRASRWSRRRRAVSSTSDGGQRVLGERARSGAARWAARRRARRRSARSSGSTRSRASRSLAVDELRVEVGPRRGRCRGGASRAPPRRPRARRSASATISSATAYRVQLWMPRVRCDGDPAEGGGGVEVAAGEVEARRPARGPSR